MSKNKKILIALSLTIWLAMGLFGFYAIAEASTTLSVPILTRSGLQTEVSSIAQYIEFIYDFATLIVGGVALVMIIAGSYQYMTSAGNPAKLGAAKETIMSALLGLVMTLMAWFLLGAINSNLINLNVNVLS